MRLGHLRGLSSYRLTYISVREWKQVWSGTGLIKSNRVYCYFIQYHPSLVQFSVPPASAGAFRAPNKTLGYHKSWQLHTQLQWSFTSHEHFPLIPDQRRQLGREEWRGLTSDPVQKMNRFPFLRIAFQGIHLPVRGISNPRYRYSCVGESGLGMDAHKETTVSNVAVKKRISVQFKCCFRWYQRLCLCRCVD